MPADLLQRACSGSGKQNCAATGAGVLKREPLVILRPGWVFGEGKRVGNVD
jgi:hypothetical protein